MQPPSATRQTILVVEDEAMIAFLIEDAFVEAGYSVIVASNGHEATSLFESNGTRFDGLVTDIRMPGNVNGWEVARRGREMQPVLPVIYLTGDGMADWKSQGVEGSALFAKPCPPENVVAAMSKLLSH